MRRLSSTWTLILASVMLLAPAGARAQSGACASFGTICVGADEGCHFSDLAQAINAASTSAAGDTTIRVATNKTWDAQNLIVENRNLTIRGGFSSCAALFPSGRTVLSGAGSSGNSVIRVRAPSGFRSVTLRDLELRDGGSETIPIVGGGLSVEDNVAVTLRNVSVVQNDARLGGGIHVDGSDGASVRLEVGSRVVGNTGREGGGGIHCVGAGSLEMDDSLVSGNVAGTSGSTTPGAHGGGIWIDGCSLLATQSPSSSLRGLRLNLAAGAGGGAYVSNGGVATFNGQGGAPFEIVANLSGSDGGGLAVREASAVVVDSRLEGNTAGIDALRFGRGGGASLSEGLLYFTSDDCGDCSAITGNSTQTSGNFGAGWGTALHAEMPLHSTGAASLIVDRTRILGHGDSTGYVIRADTEFEPLGDGDPKIFVSIINTLVAGNDASRVFFGFGNVETTIHSSTIADNGSPEIVLDTLYQSGPLTLVNSIVRETPGTRLLPNGFGGADRFMFETACLLLHSNSQNTLELPTLPDPFTEVSDDPRFVDPASGDYRLRPDSPAVDFCPSTTNVPNDDLAGRLRGVDSPSVPNRIIGGVYDLGAYELEAGSWIFDSGFER